MGLVILLLQTKREILGIVLDRRVIPVTSYQTLDVKDRVFGIQSQLILGGISNQALPFIGKGNIRWRDTVSLVVGNDLNTSVLVDTNAAECYICIRNTSRKNKRKLLNKR